MSAPTVESTEQLLFTVHDIRIADGKTTVTAVRNDGFCVTDAIPNDTIVAVVDLDHGPLSTRVEDAVSAGSDAFFCAVGRAFPEITTGDLAPFEDQDFENAAKALVTSWYRGNYGRVLDPARRPIVTLEYHAGDDEPRLVGFAAEYIAPERWNGFARPAFTKEQVVAILRFIDTEARSERKRKKTTILLRYFERLVFSSGTTLPASSTSGGATRAACSRSAQDSGCGKRRWIRCSCQSWRRPCSPKPTMTSSAVHARVFVNEDDVKKAVAAGPPAVHVSHQTP